MSAAASYSWAGKNGEMPLSPGRGAGLHIPLSLELSNFSIALCPAVFWRGPEGITPKFCFPQALCTKAAGSMRGFPQGANLILKTTRSQELSPERKFIFIRRRQFFTSRCKAELFITMTYAVTAELGLVLFISKNHTKSTKVHRTFGSRTRKIFFYTVQKSNFAVK